MYSPIIREINRNDLPQLLELYKYLGENPVPQDVDEIDRTWKQIRQFSGYHILGVWVGERLVSSCTLLIIPNLTHELRPYALVENVVTHPDFREKGLGSSVLSAAREIAQNENCYKIMLMTGSKKESTHQFYQQAGYSADLKTGYCQKLK
ncbi:MAG: GNAT family N-acetyltransferase [Candidatus Merdivicinus sp.]|jgi:GNAT superfamily N-acetyltransferase